MLLDWLIWYNNKVKTYEFRLLEKENEIRSQNQILKSIVLLVKGLWDMGGRGNQVK